MQINLVSNGAVVRSLSFPIFRDNAGLRTPAYERMIKKAYGMCDKIDHEHAEAAEYDAGFDAGEFSGPEHARMAQREKDRVAKMFGFEDFDALETEAIRFGIVSFNPSCGPDDDSHDWQEQPGEPPFDSCPDCGAIRR